jgi:hypothetical protein
MYPPNRGANEDTLGSLIVITLEGAFGSRQWMQQIGKLGGQAAVRSRRVADSRR